ncbi:MAG: HAMP domain-containing protein [Anaerolineae bacterium]|nr:HAMP domain-containing protein [Anaerolineae bacterium]
MNETLLHSLIMVGLLIPSAIFALLVVRARMGQGIVFKLGIVSVIVIITEVELGFILGAIGLTFWNAVGLFSIGISSAILSIYVMFRLVVIPIQELVGIAKQIAMGDLSQTFTYQSDDEIGQLADILRQTVSYQRGIAAAAADLAQGNVNTTIVVHSNQDVAGNAFRRMVAYQRRISEAASSLARGDLTVTVAPQADEDMLGHAFAQMIANLRELVGQVQRSAGEIATAAQQITEASEQSAGATGQVVGTIQQLARSATHQTERMVQTVTMVQHVAQAIEGVSRGAQEQSIAVTQASDTTTHITRAIQQVVNNARVGAEDATRTAQTAQSGARTIEATIQGMQTIKKAQDEARNKVTEMGARAEEIGMIVVAIEKITSQTNLLSLNAAIEAARAGEHGKGFAVVADEVRRLAENAANATREIVALVRSIQKSVTEAVQAMEAGAAEMDTGVARSQEAGQALGEILGGVSLVNQQMTDIAHAAQQMNQAAQEMVNAVESVSAVVEENTAATEEMASSAEEVLGGIEEVVGITEENSASVEEVSASIEEVSAQAEEVTASAETLREMAQELNALVARFRLEK